MFRDLFDYFKYIMSQFFVIEYKHKHSKKLYYLDQNLLSIVWLFMKLS